MGTVVSLNMVVRRMNRGQGLQGRPQGMVRGGVLVQEVEERKFLLNGMMKMMRI